VAKTRD